MDALDPFPWIDHIQQPPGSSLCAHACLAMILGISLDEACTLMGHRRKTLTRELVKALGQNVLGPSLIFISTEHPIPDTVVLKVNWYTGNKKRRGHFVLKIGENLHDPMLQFVVDFHQWIAAATKEGMRITSFLPVSITLPRRTIDLSNGES
ncbi:MAG TPA: hypothetical protein VIE65_21320 [Methylobacter sp.]|jgi:hypothetical protein